MTDVIVNVAKVAFLAALYLFLFYVARAVRRHVSAEAPPRLSPPVVRPFTLAVGTGRSEPRVVEVRRAVVVGRSPEADVTLDDDAASGRHARFEAAEGGLFVEDLGSTNGTLVNGKPTIGRVPVAVGDTVQIGETIVEIR